MKKLLPIAIISLVAGLFSGCQSIQITPAQLASATQQGITVAGQLFLARNPSYTAEVQAAADAFTALAASNPAAITPADINAALAKTSISAKTQADISAGAILALSLFETNFKINLPSLPTNYALFANAVAAGLNAAIPHPAS